MIEFTPRKQNDPRWGNTKLGPTGPTIAEQGCLVCCESMQLEAWNIHFDPGQLAKFFTKQGGFTPKGQLYWAVLSRAFPSVYWHKRVETTLASPRHAYRRDVKNAVARIRRLVKIGMPTPILVKSGHGPYPNHWVLGYERLPGDIQICDPIDAKRIPFTQRYGPLYKNVYGYSEIVGPASSPAIGGDSRWMNLAWKHAEMIQGRNVELYLRESFEHILKPDQDDYVE